MSHLLVSRTDVVEVVETLQFNDAEDTFEREPFSVLVRHKETRRGETFSAVKHKDRFYLAALEKNRGVSPRFFSTAAR